MRSLRRVAATGLATLLTVTTLAVAESTAAAEGAPEAVIKINEVRSSSGATSVDPDSGADFVELVNTGDAAVDLNGWKFQDKDLAQAPLVFTSVETIVDPGERFVFWPDDVVYGDAARGLGKGDTATILLPDGTTVVDTVDYGEVLGDAHATPSLGRCDEGTGVYVLNTTATPGVANDCPVPGLAEIRINEVRSSFGATSVDPDSGADFIELVNKGSVAVDLSGWHLTDSAGLDALDGNGVDKTADIVLPASTVLEPGAILPITTDGEKPWRFGLGSADSALVYLADGATLVDTLTWTAHATPSLGRCPDGVGGFVTTLTATPGLANDCPVVPGAADIRINEVNSDPVDWFELTNIGTEPVDVSGWIFTDNDLADPTHRVALPAGTVIEPGAFLAIDSTVGFGKGDSVNLFLADGVTAVDTVTWPADTHAVSWGRCPDGTGAFAATLPTPGGANGCVAGTPEVRINEIESNGDKVADWVELVNVGTAPADLSGWRILDADPEHVTKPVLVPAGTIVAAGGFFALYTELNQPNGGFGLGSDDSVTLFEADGTTQVDNHAWTGHAATTYGRCPDGSGDFVVTTASTRGAANACSPVRINEVESDGDTTDWIELKNISGAPVDVSGWTLKDNDDTHGDVLPAGTVIPAAGHLAVDLSFGLGDADSARLYDATATLIESYSWAVHATASYGRCKDGLGDFVDNVTSTRDAANNCPGLDTLPWPGSQEVVTADLAETFNADVSGLAFDPVDPNILWAAQNKRGTLWKLTKDGATFKPAADWESGKDPKYVDGTGAPDTEGLTIGGDGYIYAASERNNDASGISRMSILRYDPAATTATLVATDEWDVTAQIQALAPEPIGANLGLEGVTFVPDSFLVANGFKDVTKGTVYSPADYPGHGSGLYFVAVEAGGSVHAFALGQTAATAETANLVATVPSGFPSVMDVVFDPERQRVWTVCDDTCDGKFSLLEIVDGTFTVAEAYDRPVTMPNLNNEGLAIAPQSTCVDGEKQVVWSDDGDTDGFSLRSGTIECMELPPATAPGAPAAPAAEPGPKGGKRTVTVSWTAPTVTGGTPITGYRVVTYRLDARGRVISETSLEVPESPHEVVLTLRPGKYRFAVGAGNAIGYGDLSPTSAAVRPR